MDESCKKVSYSTQEFAEMDIKRFGSMNREVKPTRAYLCIKCNTWHLTSSPINANVVKKYYNTIIDLKSKIKILESNNIELNKTLKKQSNNSIQVSLIKVKQECKKHKKKANEYIVKFSEKCKEFDKFKKEVNKLIKRLEESEVSNG